MRSSFVANQTYEVGFSDGIDVYLISELDALFNNFVVVLPEIGWQVDLLDGQPGPGRLEQVLGLVRLARNMLQRIQRG